MVPQPYVGRKSCRQYLGPEGAQPTGRAADPAEQFFSLDAVTFNDLGAALPAVTLAGALTPGSITVNNTVQNYSFTGAGGVLGAPLTKQGAGSLSFNNGQQQFRRTCYH